MSWNKWLWLAVVSCAASGFAAENGGTAFLERRFKQLDKNNDGKLTKTEAGNAAWFERIDQNGDGVITVEEVRAVGAALAGRSGTVLRGTIPGSPEAGTAEDSPRQGPKVLKASERGVGQLVPDLSFADINGQTVKLSDFKSQKAVVIAFTSTSCPLTKKYAPSLARLEKEFAGKGVAFLFINPVASDSPESIQSVISETGFSGKYVHDSDGKIAAALGARSTAEIFVLDAARTLVFRGAMDDQYGLGYALDAPRRTYLKDALTAVLTGQTPAIAATEAPGCALDAKPAPALTENITYHNRISRILQNNCLECHHTGGLAPFSLESYDGVKSHAAMMRKQVDRGAMPPWFAAPALNGEPSHWQNDRSLSPQDKADLISWLASDQPPGNPADAPLARAFPAGWQIGQPDAVLELPRAVAIKAEGVMPYQTLTVQTTFSEDKWVQAYEVQPTARDVVHHVIIKIHQRGAKTEREKDSDGSNERDGFFAAYVPGNNHAIFPDGFAKKIPAGATVSFQMHYTPGGKATSDQTRLGLIFAKEPPRHVIHVAGLTGARLSIPPGAANHRETTSITLPFDTTLLSFMPHAHVRGKAARYEAALPDGTSRVLLDVPRYDFNWQLQYKLAEPLTLPRGTKLTYTAWYDNSPNNPANPDPTKLVRWGPQTFDEMMLGYVEYFVPAPKTLKSAKRGAQ